MAVQSPREISREMYDSASFSRLATVESEAEVVTVRSYVDFGTARTYSKACSHVTMYHDDYNKLEHVVDYDPATASTFAVLCSGMGSVFRNKLLWMEELVVLVCFALTTFLAHWFFLEGITESSNAIDLLHRLSNRVLLLATFLMGFYTSLSVGRWWHLRTSGVGNIWSAASQLSVLVSQFATRDIEILSAIRRYARASLVIVFLKRRYAADFPNHIAELSERGILTEEEVRKLDCWKSNLSESIWVWNMAIVRTLDESGKIPKHLTWMFVEAVMLGRSGAAVVGAQMGTPIPYPYVHIIGFMVKAYNVILAISMGLVMTHAIHEQNIPEMIVTCMKVSLMPLVYNAVLIMNCGLADPFGTDQIDFPLQKYEQGIESDGLSYIAAGEHLPDWLRTKSL